MKIEFDKDTFVCFFINILFVILFYLFNTNIVATASLFGIYLIYLMTLDNFKIIEYQFCYMILCSTIVDITYSINIEITPMYIKMFTDIISLCILFKIILKKEKFLLFIKDPLMVFGIFILIFGWIYSVICNNHLYSIFDTYRRIFRFFPIYFFFAYERYDFNILKNKFSMYFIFNIMVFILQCFFVSVKDFRNGMFSKISTAAFYYFLVIFFSNYLSKCILKKKKISELIFIFVFIILALILQDGKAYIMFFVVSTCVITLLFYKNLFKKVFFIVLIICCIPIGMKIMEKMLPNAVFFYNSKNLIKTGIEYMTINNNSALYEYNRFEAVSKIKEIEEKSIIEKLIGNGIGSSLSPENFFYSRYYHYSYNQKTRFFNSYERYGYQLSSFNCWLLDFGWIGIILIVLYFMVSGVKVIKIINKKSNIINKNAVLTVGISFLFILLSLIYNFIYSNLLYTRECSFILLAILGIIKKIKRGDIVE